MRDIMPLEALSISNKRVRTKFEVCSKFVRTLFEVYLKFVRTYLNRSSTFSGETFPEKQTREKL